jgi:hypothetical protein
MRSRRRSDKTKRVVGSLYGLWLVEGLFRHVFAPSLLHIDSDCQTPTHWHCIGPGPPGFLVKKAENAVTDHNGFSQSIFPQTSHTLHLTSANELALENDSVQFGLVREPLDLSPQLHDTAFRQKRVTSFPQS